MSDAIEIELRDGKGTVHGYCDDRFQRVLDAFIKNFEERQEQGASVCFNVEGGLCYIVSQSEALQDPNRVR